MSRILVFSFALLVIEGCAGPRVDFGAAVSDVNAEARQYRALQRDWTRYVHVNRVFDVAFDAHVAVLTPQFRSAYAEKRAAILGLAPDKHAQLVVAERDLAHAFVDVVVVLQTARWDWNDLSSPKSIWGITFRDDQGHETAPLERMAYDEKPEMVEALFPGVTPFSRFWRIRFPAQFTDGTPLLRTGENEVVVRFSGPLGVGEARYRAR